MNVGELSIKIFRNSELITVMITCILVFSLVLLVFSYFPETVTFPKKKYHSLFRQFRKAPEYTKTDYLLMTLITALYALVSFWQLGNTIMPVTTWQPENDKQSFVLRLEEETDFDTICTFYGEGDNNSNPVHYQLGYHDLEIQGSSDGTDWEDITILEKGSIYHYTFTEGEWDYRYIRVTSTSPDTTLSEIGFKKTGEDRLLPVSVYEDIDAEKYPASLVVDEQECIVLHPTYQDQSYFDEVYHPRNAWEIANGQYMYASVHPLLGTSLIALSIKIFGMHPLAWRIPGALFGVLLVPLLYAVLKVIFIKPEYAALGTLLFSVDFMHITTSRIATLEPFSVFFILLMYYYMLRYYYTNFYDTSWRVQRRLLLCSGIAMGLGIATKWTACYSAVGLAVLFFTNLYLQYRQTRIARTMLKTDLPEDNDEVCEDMIKVFSQRTLRTILWCILVFVILPVVIYFASYIPCKVWRDGYSISNVIDQIKYIYNYHIDLEATHPYQSTWWQWILDIRPIWYYDGVGLEPSRTIACFSNPVVCWGGFFAILLTIYKCVRDRDDDAFVILVGYLSAIMPWVLVQRCVFAYHFYPTSFFMIMGIVYAVRVLIQRNDRWRKYTWIYAGLSVLVFILFLPVLTGFGTTPEYIKFLEWLPSWYFG